MTTAPRLPDYLRHMQEAAEQTLAYLAGMDQEAFQTDRRTLQAVLFNFVILGEAATKLMADHAGFLAQHPTVPWRAIRDMRNRVAHGYFKVDHDVLWTTATTALPALLAELPAVIAAADRQAAKEQPPTDAS